MLLTPTIEKTKLTPSILLRIYLQIYIKMIHSAFDFILFAGLHFLFTITKN